MILLNDEKSVNKVFVIGDTRRMCEAVNIADGLLYLIAVYFLTNLNYPEQFAQILGLLQHMCLHIDFPKSLRSAAFDRVRESLLLEQDD